MFTELNATLWCDDQNKYSHLCKMVWYEEYIYMTQRDKFGNIFQNTYSSFKRIRKNDYLRLSKLTGYSPNLEEQKVTVTFF